MWAAYPIKLDMFSLLHVTISLDLQIPQKEQRLMLEGVQQER
jgi:hypothetical protein